MSSNTKLLGFFTNNPNDYRGQLVIAEALFGTGTSPEADAYMTQLQENANWSGAIYEKN